MKLIRNKLLQQIAGFSFVGLLVNAFSALLLYLALGIFKLNTYLAYISIYFISITLSYFLNGKVVFKSGLSLKTYYYYNMVYAISMILGIVILLLVEFLFSFDDFINALIPLPFTMLWNFLFVKGLFEMISKKLQY